MPTHLMGRKATHFVLWRPGRTTPPPKLFIGNFQGHASTPFGNFRTLDLSQPDPIQFPDLWEIAADQCGLSDHTVYYYFFLCASTNVYDANAVHKTLYCTDPTATTVNRQVKFPRRNRIDKPDDPASVVLYRDGKLIPCDPEGQTVNWDGDVVPSNLPVNHRLVLYELPTRWVSEDIEHNRMIGNGTFKDVLSLISDQQSAPDFPNLAVLANGQDYLVKLGVNALELLPPADSEDRLEWGYGTTNFFAADFDLGLPAGAIAPTATTDLANLIKVAHQNGIRVFIDVVMAFSRRDAYRDINFLDFHIHHSSGDPEQGNRDGFGGDLFKYRYEVEGYNPIDGRRSRYVPARALMKAYIAHWLDFYHVDGLRLDSINNIDDYNFLQEFRDFARQVWRDRGGPDDRFLVVGEELSVPRALLDQNRLDGLWNEHFKQIVRQVVLGRNWFAEPSFEWSVRKMIDCRLLDSGFTDMAQAVNYITSHDVGGIGNERLYNWLKNNGVVDVESRIKLAFVCLFTAVGIPMIFAGEEFADQHDLDLTDEHSTLKQIDPVNYARADEPWRRRIFDYVSRLAHFRKTSDALAVNDTAFIHADFNDGKRVIAWQRGNQPDNLVVVVANFSDYGTPPGSDYVIPNWPRTSAGKQWKEITQSRLVSSKWVGREGIFPWEAKVYTMV